MKKKSQHYSKKPKDIFLKDGASIQYGVPNIIHNSWRLAPQHANARYLLSPVQTTIISAICITAILFCLIDFANALFMLLLFFNILFFINNLARCYLFYKGLGLVSKEVIGYTSIADNELPNYTVLVPLFDEYEIIEQTIKHLIAIRYPKYKLQILLILEESDPLTIAALNKMILPVNFEKIIVPYSEPQTKPKACNYALVKASGQFITIYDAEDKPDKYQLRKIIKYFSMLPQDVACIQARLNFYNRKQNLLTCFFSIEYKILFNYLLPALEHSNHPIPLGGTSNHFRIQVLRELGGWDAYNVTEDADIGMRLSKAGYKVKTISSYTMEESVSNVMAWYKQRSRWIKGFVQTYFVHMRNITAPFSSWGIKNILSMNYFVGGSSLLLITIPAIVLLTILSYSNIISMSSKYIEILSMFGIINMCLNFVISQQQAYMVSKRIGISLLYPFYFALHILAAMKASLQLIDKCKLHYWEKTRHKGKKQ